MWNTIYIIYIYIYKGGNNMLNDKTKMYAPHQRDFYDQEPQDIRSYSETDSTMLPDPVTDPIVCYEYI